MLEATKEAIYNKLNGTSAVTNLLASASAIYYEFAPVDSAMPYIVFNLAGGGSDNDTPTDSADMMFYIKGVSKVAATSLSIATAIYNALHEQEASITIDNPWTVYRVTHNEPISMTETEEKGQYYHRGGSYRIRISQ